MFGVKEIELRVNGNEEAVELNSRVHFTGRELHLYMPLEVVVLVSGDMATRSARA